MRSFLVDEALHCISGLPLTNDNYENALKSRKYLYGNNQIIISAHMNVLIKPPKVRNDDTHGLRKIYDDTELNIRSLSSLGIETSIHGTLIATLILEKLLQEIKLVVVKILDIVNQEFGAREACAERQLKMVRTVQTIMKGFHIQGRLCI